MDVLSRMIKRLATGGRGIAARGLTLHAAMVIFVVSLPATMEVGLGQIDDDGETSLRWEDDSLTERVVRSFSFDEPENATAVPRFWVRISGPNFPHWNESGFWPEELLEGATNRAVRVPVRGGSAGLQLTAGVIPAIAQVDYHLRVRVRTVDCVHSRARLAAWFSDETGAAIDSTIVESDPVQTEGEWVWLDLTLSSPSASALTGEPAWIQVELRLEQPNEWMDRAPVGQEVRFEDVVDAHAVFDDLRIWRIPRVRIHTATTGLYHHGEPIEIGVSAQDVASAQLRLQARLVDLRGRVQAELDVPLENAGHRALLRPTLEQAGWYRIIAEVSEGGRIIDRRATDFTVLGSTSGSEAPHGMFEGFGIILDAQRTSSTSGTTLMLEGVGASVIWLPVWHEDVTPATAMDARDELQQIVRELGDNGRKVAMFIPAQPDSLHLQASSSSWSSGSDEGIWPIVEGYLTSFGQRVACWQFGPMDSLAGANSERLWPGLQRLLDRLPLYVVNARLSVPWSVEHAGSAEWLMGRANLLPKVMRNETRLGFNVHLGQEIQPEFFGDHLETWADSIDEQVFILETALPDEFGWAHAARDLAKRAVYAWEAGSRQLLIEAPWESDQSRGGGQGMTPTPLLCVWRTVGAHLSGRSVVARLDLGSDIRAFIVQDDDGEDGTLVLWHESSTTDTARLSTYLGAAPIRMTNIHGTVRDVDLVDGLHEFTVGADPVFLDGADINLARFRSAFKIEPAFIEGAAALHQHHFVMKNPWPTTIAGNLTILEPADWNIRERLRRISIAPGEEVRMPVVFSYPAYETAGPKRFVIDIELDSSLDSTIRIEGIAELGMERATLVPLASIEHGPDGDEQLVIAHQITNNSEEPLWLTAFTVAEGLGRQEFDVPKLAAGETTVRVFRYTDPWNRLQSDVIRVGVRERGGPGLINMLIAVEDIRAPSADQP